MIGTTSQKSFVERMQKFGGGDNDPLCLIRAKDYSGHKAYYFLKIDALKLPMFEKVADSGNSFDMEAYGEIVARGYGEEVPEHVLMRMRMEYGWSN